MAFKILTSCEQAGHYCDKGQYGEITHLEKLKLAFHILFCKACEKHTKRNFKLTQLIKSANLKMLGNSEKSDLEQLIKDNLKK